MSLLVVFSCEEANKANCNQRVRESQGLYQQEEGRSGRVMGCPSRGVPVQHDGVWVQQWGLAQWSVLSVQHNHLLGLRSCRILPVQGRGWENWLGKLNTEGLCWSCAPAEDAGPRGATEDAAATVAALDSSPVPASSASPRNEAALDETENAFTCTVVSAD